ncbi:MAG: type 1 glutamine amidotransferase [Candidatus Latescibacteria bacterium]|nr:type 1 glutamine amidotransferase [Candidatus Latescibacterota bacterium]
MKLTGKKIALFVENLYDEREFWYSYYRMQEEGAEVVVIAPKAYTYKSKTGMEATADKSINDVKASQFDALIIPGGFAPDFMRRTPKMVEFVKHMHEDGKVIGAICHAGWMLASAGILKGKKVTSFFAIKDDVVNAGAEWIDREVVRDGNIITSRKQDDLPAFCKTIIEALQ